MSYYQSDSDDETSRRKLFGRQRPIHEVLGGRKVADVLLWKNKNVSAALTIGMTLIWFLFEVVEYNFVTLLCHIFITIMLIVFIWCTGAEFFNWHLPKIPRSTFEEHAFQDMASIFHEKFNLVLSILLEIASGRDPILFILTIVSLYIFSVIGDYFTFMNFLYLVFLCIQTLPFLYNRYEAEVDELAGSLFRQARKIYRRLDSRILNKIPRGPIKEKIR